MIIDNTFKKEVDVRLTMEDIDNIIECLEYQNHNLFMFLHYNKIIEKLKQRLEQ